MGKSKEYEMAIKIAGQVEQSFKNSMGLTERQLQSIARQAAASSRAARNSLSSAFEDANKVVDEFSSGAKKALKVVGTTAAATATAVSAIGAASIAVGKDFEAQMSTVKAISNATGSEMEALNAKAKQMGEDTVFSATEAGEAMEYMAMAGWKSQDMLNGIEGIMNLAAASGENLGTVSDIVTDALTAFGLTAQNTQAFVDDLAQAASNSNTNVSMMGESFKQVATAAGALNYSTKDAAVALGIMANSGIKGEKAGTQLAKIFTRMSGTNKNATEAMKELGLEMFNSDGSARVLSDVMEDLREKFHGLTDAQKENYAYQLAGQSGMNGLLAIVNTSNKDFKKLTEAINDSTGAAQRMANIKIDNLEGDTTLLESATEGLGIEIFEQMDDGLREIVQSITSEVGDITEYLQENQFIEEFADNIKEYIPTMIRNLKEAGEAVAEFSQPFMNVAQWMLEHPEVIESTLAGIVTTIVSLKVASKVNDVASSFGTLAGVLTNPFAVAILAVGTALGGAAGISTYINKCETATKNQNLAEHFGEISLSLKELEDVTNRILDDGSLTKLNSTLEEFDKVDEIADGIEDTVKELDKYNWKVSLGLKLTKDEKQAYKNDITSYIEETQNLVEQQRYAISLSFDLLTGEGSDIGTTTDSFLADKEADLTKLGKKLQKTVNKAFSDGLLTVDEEKKIQEIQQQMSSISDGITQSNFNASLELIAGEYSGGNLTTESFKNLQKELQDKVDEATEGYKEALQESIAALDYRLQEGNITQGEYDNGVQELREGYRTKVAEAEAKASEFLLNTIMEQYNDELSDASKKYDEIMKNYMSRETDWTNNAGQMWDGLTGQFDNELLDNTTSDAIEELLGQLELAETQMRELVKQYEKDGEEIPQAIVDSLNQIETLKAYTGDKESLWKTIEETLLNEEDYTAVIEKAKEAGGYIPEEIKEGMVAKAQEAAKTSSEILYDTMGNAITTEYSKSFDVGVKINTDNTITNNALNTEAQNVRKQMENILTQKFSSVFELGVKVHAATTNTRTDVSKIAHNAKGSIIEKPTLSWFAEDYPEAAIPIDGSARSKSLWVETGRRLGMYNGYSTALQAEQLLNRDSSSLASSKCLNMLNEEEGGQTEITYAPRITIQGNASKQDILEASELAQEKFERMMERYIRNRKRTAF